jgi:hypothetical protein
VERNGGYQAGFGQSGGGDRSKSSQFTGLTTGPWYLGEQKMNRRCPMLDVKVANRPALQMQWVPVTDERGRTHMESVWVEIAETPAIHHAA